MRNGMSGRSIERMVGVALLLRVLIAILAPAGALYAQTGGEEQRQTMAERLEELRAIREDPFRLPSSDVVALLADAIKSGSTALRERGVEALFWHAAMPARKGGGDRDAWGLDFSVLQGDAALRKALYVDVDKEFGAPSARFAAFCVAAIWPRDRRLVERIREEFVADPNEADSIDYAKILARNGLLAAEIASVLDPAVAVVSDQGLLEHDRPERDSPGHEPGMLEVRGTVWWPLLLGGGVVLGLVALCLLARVHSRSSSSRPGT